MRPATPLIFFTKNSRARGAPNTSTQSDSVISKMAYLCSHGLASTFTSIDLNIGHAVLQSTSNGGAGTGMVRFRNGRALHQADQVVACLFISPPFLGACIIHNGIGRQGATSQSLWMSMIYCVCPALESFHQAIHSAMANLPHHNILHYPQLYVHILIIRNTIFVSYLFCIFISAHFF